MLVVVVVLFRVWWGYEARRRLQAEIDRCLVAGQLVYAEDFDAELDAVPDDQNAAILLERAINRAVITSTSGIDVDTFVYEPVTFETDPAAAKELIEGNAAVFELVRHARGRQQVAWSDRLADRLTGGGPGYLEGQRRLAKLLRFAATYHLRTGSHAEAFETLHDLVAVGEAAEEPPSLLSGLVGWGCQGTACRAVEEHGGGLIPAGGGTGVDADSYPARRAQVFSLIAGFLDETERCDVWIRMLQGERAVTLAKLDATASGKGVGGGATRASAWSSVLNSLRRPVLELDTARLMQRFARAADAGTRSSYPEAVSVMGEASAPPSFIRVWSRPLSHGDPVPGVRVLELFFRIGVMRRMAAAALAIRLYVVDHGVRPTTLDMLVPDYLPEVPVDLFSADGAALRYKPDAEWPVIYSVGRDGKDHGGVEARTPEGKRDFEHSDIPFYLDGRPPRRLPSS